MPTNDITQLILASNKGDKKATERLYSQVYKELHVIAHSHRRRWLGSDTLNTTAIINEAYLKLAKGNYLNRTHFYATASKAMRQILISYAHAKKTQKRKHQIQVVENIDLLQINDSNTIEELIIVDQLLTSIENNNSRQSQIVECRIFGGMSISETSKALNMSISTVKREWALLSAWLYRELKR